jgi:outer membrane protein OmpA-like peptidoglycan-associated protein
MAETIQFGHCSNTARCSLAFNHEKIFVPLDGNCPECGLPLKIDSMARRRLKSLLLLVILGLLAAGGYYAKVNFIDAAPHNGTAPTPTPTAASNRPSATIAPADNGNGSDIPPPAAAANEGAVDRPNFALENDANAKARHDVLLRIGLMPHLTDAQKSKLTTAVDRARGMGCIFIIPFEVGKKALGDRETDILVSGFKSASIQKLMEDPTLVFVVLGYADTQGDAQQNDKASVERAENVVSAMRDRAGVQNVMYAVGMGGSSLFDTKSPAKNRLVEIWAVYP